MLVRKIEENIKNWLKNGENALLIQGARQVGKTFIIRKVLKESNIPFFEFNFLNNEILTSLFETSRNDIDQFVRRLGLLVNREIPKGSVIFLDEVQACKEIVTYIKFLVDQGDYKFILSGSLLGIELVNIKSAPVGYLDILNMYPLDLEEFALNQGTSSSIIEEIKECFEQEKPVNPVVHEKMMQIFRNYLLVGGLPDAVQAYVDEKDFHVITNIHKNIIELYKKDFSKYELNSKLKLIKIYDLMPSELNDPNKRFIFTNVEKNARFSKYENSFNWLIDAGVAIPTFNVKEPRLPLKINMDLTSFKFFMSDVGLLTSCYGESSKIAILNGDNSINAGAIYENFVAQELKAHNFDLFYYNHRRLGELDFVIENGEESLPIEVKSGKDYKRHSAVLNTLKNESLNINKIVVLTDKNLSKHDKVLELPIYMIMFFNSNESSKIKLHKVVF